MSGDNDLHEEWMGGGEVASLRAEIERLRADNERLRVRVREMSALASVVRERVNDLICIDESSPPG